MLIGLKYLIFYKDIDEAFELRCTYIEELTRKFAEEREGEGGDQSSNSADEGISVSHNTERSSEQPGRSLARYSLFYPVQLSIREGSENRTIKC